MHNRDAIPGGGSATDPDPAGRSPTFLNEAGALTRELRELVHDHLQLAALEARLAVRTVGSMIALAVVMGLLLASVWLALIGATVMLLIAYGQSAVVAMVVAAVINLTGVLLCYLVFRYQLRGLGLPASLRMLKSAAAQPAPGSA
jgi:hypothetical protein